VQVVPYNLQLTPGAAATLNTLLGRAFGARTEIVFAETVPLGGEDALAVTMTGSPSLALALFAATATPENEHHGAFIDALGARLHEVPLAVIVDESAFRRRLGDQPERLTERRAAWQRLLAAHDRTPVFIELDAGVTPAAEQTLQIALDTYAQADAA